MYRLKRLAALLLILSLVPAGMPATAFASGDGTEDGVILSPPPVIRRSGGIVSPPAVSLHRENAGVAEDGYPAYYRLDGSRLTSVKNQNPYGTCWAHAAMASSESIAEGAGLQNEPDFSEWQLAYFSYMSQNGRPAFDLADGDTPFEAGGNDNMAVALMERGSSPVMEAAAPYNGGNPSPGVKPAYTLRSWKVAHTPGEWKALVMAEGALSISYYWDGSAGSQYYNAAKHSYYCPVKKLTNHAVTLVGWDDNYPASNFLKAPPGNGAWIVKNSWGASWGDAGFFYLSYYDSTLSTDASAYELMANVPGEKAYSYDDLGWVAMVGYKNETAAMKCVFTAAGEETLQSVGTYATGDNTAYSLTVRTKNPATGAFEPAWSAPQAGTIKMAGYARIALASPVRLAAGQAYEVIISVTVPGSATPLPIEERISGYSSHATCASGQSFISPNGSGWYDLAGYDSSACLSAFTVPAATGGTTHTVTFNSQGGSAVAAATASHNAVLSKPANPTKTGHAFAGWYREAACATAWNFASDTVTADITLYAKWTANRYTVRFDSRGGSAVAGKTAAYNTKITAPKAPTRSGYVFLGWYKQAACTSAWNFSADTVKGNTTLYARWISQAAAATLGRLKLSAGSLSPSFKPSVKRYTVNLGENTAGVTVTPVKAYSGAALTINGAKASSRYVAVANGKSAKLTIKVACGARRTTYTVTVRRAKSANNRLSGIRATAGTLSPAFSPAATSYRLTLPKGTARVTLTTVRASKLASVTPAAKAVTLRSGQTVTVTFRVKAQSGAVRTYRVQVTRAG